jgi:hypothetical protein
VRCAWVGKVSDAAAAERPWARRGRQTLTATWCSQHTLDVGEGGFRAKESPADGQEQEQEQEQEWAWDADANGQASGADADESSGAAKGKNESMKLWKQRHAQSSMQRAEQRRRAKTTGRGRNGRCSSWTVIQSGGC